MLRRRVLAAKLKPIHLFKLPVGISTFYSSTALARRTSSNTHRSTAAAPSQRYLGAWWTDPSRTDSSSASASLSISRGIMLMRNSVGFRPFRRGRIAPSCPGVAEHSRLRRVRVVIERNQRKIARYQELSGLSPTAAPQTGMADEAVFGVASITIPRREDCEIGIVPERGDVQEFSDVRWILQERRGGGGDERLGGRPAAARPRLVDALIANRAFRCGAIPVQKAPPAPPEFGERDDTQSSALHSPREVPGVGRPLVDLLLQRPKGVPLGARTRVLEHDPSSSCAVISALSP